MDVDVFWINNYVINFIDGFYRFMEIFLKFEVCLNFLVNFCIFDDMKI